MLVKKLAIFTGYRLPSRRAFCVQKFFQGIRIVSSLEIGCISACCIAAGLFMGLFLGYTLPESHLNDHSKDTIKMASGMIATLSALVLGLLVASAKNSFDTISNADTVTGANIILLDRVLSQYGAESKPARNELRKSVNDEVQSIWPKENPTTDDDPIQLEKAGDLEPVQQKLNALNPANDDQRATIQQARQLLGTLVQERWQLIEESKTEVPTALYVVLLSWLTILFMSFGLFAPRNITVLMSLILCIISFSTAIFLFDEMASPLDGMIKVSGAPMQKALDHLGQQ